MSVVAVTVLLSTCVVLGRCNSIVNDHQKRWDVFSRVKRENIDKRAYTQAEKQQILDLHNKYRSEEMATDMTLMEWDDDLAQIAQDWANMCDWTHSSSVHRKGTNFRYVGENLYAKTNSPTPVDVVKSWVDEKDYFNYNTLGCSKVCGHYTQVVWAKSYALGCGIRFCSSIQNLNWERFGGGYIVVCNYGPGGNYIGQKPYTRGQNSCSKCSDEFPYCVQGLCSKTEDKVPVASSPKLHQQGIRYSILVVILAVSLS